MPGVQYDYINRTNHLVINCANPVSQHECVQAGRLLWAPVPLTFHSNQARLCAADSLPHSQELGFDNVYANSAALRSAGTGDIISVFRQAVLLVGTHFSSSLGKDGNYHQFTPGWQTFSSSFFLPLFKFFPQVIQDSLRKVMGNLSGVIKILWVFVPLIVMGLDGYTTSEASSQQEAMDSKV